MKKMTLRDLFEMKLHALYDIENVLVKTLPKLAKAASDPELRKGFTDHLEETKNHVERLKKIYTLLGIKPKKLSSDGIRGIVADGAWVIKHTKPALARDAHLARAAQFAEHYEMAGYMAAIAWANELNEPEVADLLEQTLDEERTADQTLDAAGSRLDSELNKNESVR